MEYAGNWNAIDDLLNIQYTQYTTKMEVVDGIIDHGTNVHIPEMPHDFKEKDQGRHTFQALSGLDIQGFDTDREAFLGPYRSYSNPLAVEEGHSFNSRGYGDNPCGSNCGECILEAGETREFLVILGIGRAKEEGKRAVEEFSDIRIVDRELEQLKNFWHTRMAGLTAETPDPELNSTLNTWGIVHAIPEQARERLELMISGQVSTGGALPVVYPVP